MAPQLRFVEVARYRGFRDRQRLELSRLNLLYGENNAGKSALLRVPALLAASRVPGRPGLNLADVTRKAGFREVQWRGALPLGADDDMILGVGLSDDSAWQWSFRWLESQNIAAIQEIEVAAQGQRVSFERPDRSGQNPRDAEYQGPDGPRRLQFDGLIPRGGANPLFDHCRDGLSSALDEVIWLSATRQGPTREGTPVGDESPISGNGEGAAARVTADAKLRDAVSRWFAAHARCRVEQEALGSDRERLVLEPLDAPSYPVPFPDAGEGLQQAFPVVVALELLRRTGGALCVEEPESHLHPRLQRGLAELIVSVLESQPSASVILETHSEVFLVAALSAALRPLSGKVRLYWIEVGKGGVATVENIGLDESGRPKTPRLEQAFSTMGVMRRELLQRRREETVEPSTEAGVEERGRHGD